MEIKTENRKWKTAGRFPAEILFLTGFLAGTILPNIVWKMEWKQKTLASFYLIRNFAEKDISGGGYFMEVLRRRGGFFIILFLCGFTVFGVPLSVAYMRGNRTSACIVGSGIRTLWRTCRSRASFAAVYNLCTGLFLPGRNGVPAVLQNLEKLRPGACKKRALYQKGNHGFSDICRGDSGREFSESMDC